MCGQRGSGLLLLPSDSPLHPPPLAPLRLPTLPAPLPPWDSLSPWGPLPSSTEPLIPGGPLPGTQDSLHHYRDPFYLSPAPTQTLPPRPPTSRPLSHPPHSRTLHPPPSPPAPADAAAPARPAAPRWSPAVRAASAGPGLHPSQQGALVGCWGLRTLPHATPLATTAPQGPRTPTPFLERLPSCLPSTPCTAPAYFPKPQKAATPGLPRVLLSV